MGWMGAPSDISAPRWSLPKPTCQTHADRTPINLQKLRQVMIKMTRFPSKRDAHSRPSRSAPKEARAEAGR